MRDDTDSENPSPYLDPPEVHARHLLTFRTLWYDPRHSESGISIGGIYSHVEPPEGTLFPVRFDRIFVYFQLWGDTGDYHPRIRLVKVESGEDNDVLEVQLGRDGNPREFRPPTTRSFEISGLNFVEEFAFPIRFVPFKESGTYEFQLWVDGLEEPLARERVLAREYKQDE